MWTLLAVRRAAAAACSTSAGDFFSRPLAGGPVAVVAPPVATSHNRTVPSSLPVARVLPSGLNATDQTAPACAVRGLPIWRWVATSHNRTVPSSLPVARVLPSGLNATDQTSRVCPVRGLPIWRWVATSHSRTVVS